MAQHYAYHFAVIDETGFCYEVLDTTINYEGRDGYVAIDEYNEDYLFKYYNRADGKWYTDSAFTDEWTPA